VFSVECLTQDPERKANKAQSRDTKTGVNF